MQIICIPFTQIKTQTFCLFTKKMWFLNAHTDLKTIFGLRFHLLNGLGGFKHCWFRWGSVCQRAILQHFSHVPHSSAWRCLPDVMEPNMWKLCFGTGCQKNKVNAQKIYQLHQKLLLFAKNRAKKTFKKTVANHHVHRYHHYHHIIFF